MRVPHRRIALLSAFLLAGCVHLDFSRRISDEESILRAEIRSYYDAVAAAFAVGNADALAGLFDPSISKPMTREQIRNWGITFFKQHGPAAFKVEKVDFERVGHVSAVVTLTYHVETRDAKGSFGGTERDELVKHGRHWFVASWEMKP